MEFILYLFMFCWPCISV